MKSKQDIYNIVKYHCMYLYKSKQSSELSPFLSLSNVAIYFIFLFKIVHNRLDINSKYFKELYIVNYHIPATENAKSLSLNNYWMEINWQLKRILTSCRPFKFISLHLWTFLSLQSLALQSFWVILRTTKLW